MILSLKVMIDDPDKSDELTNISSKIAFSHKYAHILYILVSIVQNSGEIKNTCSTDASCLKSLIPKYASHNLLDITIIKPIIIVTKLKVEMGLNYPLLTRWLCPINKLSEFDEDPVQ